jgi:hypothetical protein
MSVQYALASDDIVSESFDGDFVVVDLKFGKYYSFSDAGNVIWDALTSGVAPAQLLGADAEISLDELDSFIETLVGYGLISSIVPPDAGPAPDASGFSERLAGADEKPEVAVFDDMADLFKADPIHDVEENAGWPLVRQD